MSIIPVFICNPTILMLKYSQFINVHVILGGSGFMKIAKTLTVFLVKLLFILFVIECLCSFFLFLITGSLLILGIFEYSKSSIFGVVIIFLSFMFFILLSLITYRLIKYLEK